MTHCSERIVRSWESTILQPETPGQPAIRYRTPRRVVPEQCFALQGHIAKRKMSGAVGPKRLSLRPADPPYPVEAVFPVSPKEPVAPADQDQKPVKPGSWRKEITTENLAAHWNFSRDRRKECALIARLEHCMLRR